MLDKQKEELKKILADCWFNGFEGENNGKPISMDRWFVQVENLMYQQNEQPTKPVFTLEDVEEIIGEDDEIKPQDCVDLVGLQKKTANKLRQEQHQRLSAKMEEL